MDSLGSVLIFFIYYLVRRLEIGEGLARRETIIGILLLLVIIPLIVLFVLATYNAFLYLTSNQ